MSHQDRREPLQKGYQYPTHGVDCDCPPCRERVTGVSLRFIQQYNIDSDEIVTRVDLESLRVTQTAYGWGV
jgi:hypothetical protein